MVVASLSSRTNIPPIFSLPFGGYGVGGTVEAWNGPRWLAFGFEIPPLFVLIFNVLALGNGRGLERAELAFGLTSPLYSLLLP